MAQVLLHGEGAGERHGGVAGQDSGIAVERESWRALILELSVFGRWID